MWNFVRDFMTMYARTYAYLFLLTDRYPPFGSGGEHPTLFSIERPEHSSRWKTFLRYILAIPALIVAYLLDYAARLVAILAWLIIVITGRLPDGLHNFIELCNRYWLRTITYLLLLVDAYPSFEHEKASGAPVVPEPEPQPQTMA